MARIAIDATYTVDRYPSGIGLSSLHLLQAISELATPHRFLFCYRLSRFRQRARFFRPSSPRSRISIRLFQPPFTFWLPKEASVFHSLAQRPAPFRFRHEIVTVHDVFPLTDTGYSSPSFQQRFSQLLLDAVKRASAIITPSRYTAEQLLSRTDTPSEKVRVIPFGVEFPNTKISSGERSHERDALVGAGNHLVLGVGAIQVRKNTLNIVHALSHLPENYKLVLAGSDGYGAEAVDELIRREHLEARVQKLGYVTDQRLAVLYESADVLAFPSFEEGSGLPVLEAMSHSLPVVTARTSCLPELAGDAALYANPSDSRDIADQIRVATEDCHLRAALISKGLQRAREFSWQQTAIATVRLYEEVLAQRSSG